MTQTMRDKLQVAVSNIKAYIEFRKHAKQKACAAALQSVCDELESILATEPPAVTVRKGWVCKDRHGLWWCSSHEPFWMVASVKWSAMNEANCITDPWPDKPDGGPECCREVR